MISFDDEIPQWFRLVFKILWKENICSHSRLNLINQYFSRSRGCSNIHSVCMMDSGYALTIYVQALPRLWIAIELKQDGFGVAGNSRLK